jgi:hypothetical protein
LTSVRGGGVGMQLELELDKRGAKLVARHARRLGRAAPKRPTRKVFVESRRADVVVAVFVVVVAEAESFEGCQRVEGRRVGHHDRWDRSLLRSRSRGRDRSGGDDRDSTLERCREVARRCLEAVWRRVPSDGSGDGRCGKSFLHQLEGFCRHVAAVLRCGRSSSCEAVAPDG